MKKGFLIFVLTACFAVFFYSSTFAADDDFDYDAFLENMIANTDHQRMYELTAELLSLYDAGVAIHESYNFNYKPDVRYCVQKNGYLRDKAKRLRAETKDIKLEAYRWNLGEGFYDAFSCVFCGGTGSACNRIPERIDNVVSLLKKYDFEFPKN